MRRATYLLFATLLSCREWTPPHREHLPPIEPFSTLESVQLGIPVSELLRARPNLHLAPYEGYREGLAGYHVTYGVDGFYSDTATPSPQSQVTRVSATRMIFDSAEVATVWRNRFRELSALSDSKPTCVEYRGRINGNMSVWSHQRGHLALSVFTPYTEKQGNALVAQPGRLNIDVDIRAKEPAALLAARRGAKLYGASHAIVNCPEY